MMRFSHTRYFNCDIFILTQAYTNGIIISRIIRKEEECMTDREILLSLYNDMHEVKDCMTSLENRVANLESSMTILKNDVSGLKNDVSGLKNDVTNIKMTLENETNRNIRIIAEGHSDLSRKFDEALKHEQQYHEERELLIVRVNSIENDVRKIKEKVAI